MKVKNGIFYYPTYVEARNIMNRITESRFDHTKRVVRYELGWAVQLHKSGPYLGRDCKPHEHKCRWCP